MVQLGVDGLVGELVAFVQLPPVANTRRFEQNLTFYSIQTPFDLIVRCCFFV